MQVYDQQGQFQAKNHHILNLSFFENLHIFETARYAVRYNFKMFQLLHFSIFQHN